MKKIIYLKQLQLIKTVEMVKHILRWDSFSVASLSGKEDLVLILKSY